MVSIPTGNPMISSSNDNIQKPGVLHVCFVRGPQGERKKSWPINVKDFEDAIHDAICRAASYVRNNCTPVPDIISTMKQFSSPQFSNH